MIRLSSHHALGNDFLIRLEGEVDAAMARALCDRRRGIGADGLISIGPAPSGGAGGRPPQSRRWTLFNADGSRAESSGNGLRCSAQALARAKGVSELEVTFETDAGPRRVQLSGDVATVEMGPVTVQRLGERDADVDVANPHLVLLVDDPSSVDLLALGRQHPDVNVEVIAVAEPDALAFRVHERGAGITEACGTGSCAAAAAAHAWGLVGPAVVVHNPGGDVTVELKDGAALLTGETRWIADVETSWP
ncbi:MAG: diaminopimelate epimerase [Actinomycetota bacterium]|nr:diaminopimelate epimerase [Actinomycetota bacterium]